MAPRVLTRAGPRLPRLPRLRRWSLAVAGWLMDSLSRAVRRLPPGRRDRVADVLARPLLWLWAARLPVIARNFAVVLGEPETAPPSARARQLARESVRNSVRMALDFLAVRTMRDAEVLAWVRPAGEAYLREAQRDGRGVIFVLPHTGSWDVAAAFAQAYGCRLTIVTEPGWAAELVAGSRLARGITLAPRDRPLRALLRALARNEIVVMLADVAGAGVPTIEVPFFGRPAPFPTGPARLAQRTGAPILVVASARLPGGKYLVEAQPPLRADPHAPAEAAVAALTADVAAGFERIIAARPAQWYPFHAIWPTHPGRAA